MANVMRVKVEDEHVLTDSILQAIDTTNLIASGVTIPYTATQDCFALCRNAYTCYITIDSKAIARVGGNNSNAWGYWVPLKKGQKLTNSTSTRNIYGIKR